MNEHSDPEFYIIYVGFLFLLFCVVFCMFVPFLVVIALSSIYGCRLPLDIFKLLWWTIFWLTSQQHVISIWPLMLSKRWMYMCRQPRTVSVFHFFSGQKTYLSNVPFKINITAWNPFCILLKTIEHFQQLLTQKSLMSKFVFKTLYIYVFMYPYWL